MEPNDCSILVREAHKHGLTRQVLRGPDWRQLSRGLYAPGDWEPLGWERWAAMRRVLPPDSAAGHLTSAALRGWWLPMLPADLPLFATTGGTTHVQRPGVYVRRSPRTRTEIRYGTRVVRAADTVHELAKDLSVLDLVPIVESAARISRCDPQEVLETAPARLRGLAALRLAVAWADPRSESWWETMLRLVHKLSGLAVEPQQEIRDTRGFVVARVDLRLLGTNRVPEYDGEDHRRRARHVDDLRREKELGRLGLDRWGYTSPELERYPGQIVRDAEMALGLPHDPERVGAWWAAARVATVTGPGRRRLAARIDTYRRAATR